MAVNMDLYGKQFLEDYNNGDFERILTKYRKKKIREVLEKYSTRRILEIGCGMEPFFLEYHDFDHMVIVEAASIMYESALRYQKQCDFNGSIECIHDFVENKTDLLREKEFDFILLVGLIHEVEDADKLMEAVRKICFEDTYVLITTNNPKSFHLTLAYESGLIPQLGILTGKAKAFQRHSTFTMEEMKRLIERHSFSIVEKGSYFVKPFAHSQMKLLLDNQIIGEEVLNGLDALTKYIPEFGSEIYCIVKLDKSR